MAEFWDCSELRVARGFDFALDGIAIVTAVARQIRPHAPDRSGDQRGAVTLLPFYPPNFAAAAACQ